MKIPMIQMVEFPRGFCQFENYTQSFETFSILIWSLAMWGLINIIFNIYNWLRIGVDK